MAARDDVSGTTVGVTGQRWRATVTPAGAVLPWASAQELHWYIAADDRWHDPASETAVRQHRLGGAPVTETRVRIPDGDAVQRVWSVADRGGLTVIEIENDSPLPFAVAFSGIDVLTERVPTGVPVQGIELPADTITLPVAHRTSIRVAIAHGPLPAGVDRHRVSLSGLPSAETVVRGWSSLVDRASRLGLPDEALASAVVAARCDLMLEGPVDADDDPLGFVLDVGELVRCGDDADAWLPEIVEPLESAAHGDDALLGAALVAAERVACAAGDARAARDINALRRRTRKPAGSAAMTGPFSELRRDGSVGRFVHDVERRLADGVDLLPVGIPTAWLGVDFEFHGVPTSATSSASIAVRWHGERPAVLWEQTGDLQELTAVALDAEWSADTKRGEALWAAPARAQARRKLSLTTDPTSPSAAAAPEMIEESTTAIAADETGEHDPTSFS